MIDAEQLIRCEFYKVLERLGAPPAVLAASINGASKNEIYEAAERLGAGAYRSEARIIADNQRSGALMIC